MILKDFHDGNKVIVTMFRGTDKTYSFPYLEDDGSVFNSAGHTLVCEGRLSASKAVADFSFTVTHSLIGDTYQLSIVFPDNLITDSIRENTVYWKIIATNTATLNKRVLRYGELWLKGA